MKKILLLFAISALLLTGCNKASKPEPKETVETTTNTAVEQLKVSEISEIEKKIKEVRGSDIDKDSYQLSLKTLGGVSLHKSGGSYVLELEVVNAESFDKEQLDNAVNTIQEGEQEEVQLESYKICKTIPASLKEHLDFMKEKNVSGIELECWKNYSETNWINEDNIPVFIEDANGDALYVLKNINENEPERYYLFRVVVAGQDGFYSVPSEYSKEQCMYSLNSSDAIEWRRYEMGSEDIALKESKTMTVEEYFNNNSDGEESVNINENVHVENGKLVLELYDGGN